MIFQQIKFAAKMKFCLWKRYFETGMGLTNYIKYVIAFFGLASRDVYLTMIIAAIYAVICFFFGWYWVNSEFLTAEMEISNRFNPFVAEMREKIGTSTNRKV